MKNLLPALFLSSVLLSHASAQLKVASLSTITSDIAKNVGGGQIVLDAIVQPGIDPHDFEPTPVEIKKISQDNLVLITGKHIEGYLTKLEQAAGGGSKFVDTGAAVPSLRMEEDGRKIDDPHWWHSVANVEKATVVVRDAFIKADPAHQADYEKNAAAYLAKLADLKTWAAEKVAELPRNKRKLVTSHDAFQYFARDYGFQIYALEGVNPDDEPSSKKVAALIGLIKEQQVKAVFPENIENPKVLAEITKDTGATIAGDLYADGLGSKDVTTYEAMIRHNVTTIVDALK